VSKVRLVQWLNDNRKAERILREKGAL